MNASAEIRSALRDMMQEMLIDGAIQATVKSVNKDAGTIVATSLKEELDYFDVRLRAVLSDTYSQGILVYPTVGSQVSIIWLDGIDTMGFVAQFSEIEAFRLVVDNGVSLELTKEGQVLLNGESFGGLVKVAELVKRLNVLERQMLSHQHLSTAPGKETLPDLVTNPFITPTAAPDLANPNVKHG